MTHEKHNTHVWHVVIIYKYELDFISPQLSFKYFIHSLPMSTLIYPSDSFHLLSVRLLPPSNPQINFSLKH